MTLILISDWSRNDHVTFQEEKKIYLQFPLYQLEEPNDCNFNFIQIFDEKTDIEHRKRYFCGSVAEAYQSETDVLFVRYKIFDYDYNQGACLY